MAIKVIPASEILQTPNVNILNDNVIKDVNYSYNKTAKQKQVVGTIKIINSIKQTDSNNNVSYINVFSNDNYNKYIYNVTDETTTESPNEIYYRKKFNIDFDLSNYHLLSNVINFQNPNANYVTKVQFVDKESGTPVGNTTYIETQIEFDNLYANIYFTAEVQYIDVNKVTILGNLLVESQIKTPSDKLDVLQTAFPMDFSVDVVADILTTENVSVDNNSQVDLQANELIQDGTKIDNTQISQYIANNIKQYYKNGKATIGLVCNYKGDNEYKVGDLVIPMKSNTEPILLDNDGDGKVFEVTSNEITYDGFGKQSLELVEKIPVLDYPQKWEYSNLGNKDFFYCENIGNTLLFSKYAFVDGLVDIDEYAIYETKDYINYTGLIKWGSFINDVSKINYIHIAGMKSINNHLYIFATNMNKESGSDVAYLKIYCYDYDNKTMQETYSADHGMDLSSSLWGLSKSNSKIMLCTLAGNISYAQYVTFIITDTANYGNVQNITGLLMTGSNDAVITDFVYNNGYYYLLQHLASVVFKTNDFVTVERITCNIGNDGHQRILNVNNQFIIKTSSKLFIGDLGNNMTEMQIQPSSKYIDYIKYYIVIIGENLSKIYISNNLDGRVPLTSFVEKETGADENALPIFYDKVGTDIVAIGLHKTSGSNGTNYMIKSSIKKEYEY